MLPASANTHMTARQQESGAQQESPCLECAALTVRVSCSSAEEVNQTKALAPETATTTKKASTKKEAPQKLVAAENESKQTAPASYKQDKAKETGDKNPK